MLMGAPGCGAAAHTDPAPTASAARIERNGHGERGGRISPRSWDGVRNGNRRGMRRFHYVDRPGRVDERGVLAPDARFTPTSVANQRAAPITGAAPLLLELLQVLSVGRAGVRPQ